MKPTSAPWKVGNHGLIEGVNKEYIGLLTNREEYAANASLVEAAPDLYQALELADGLLSQLGRVYDGSSQQHTIHAALKRARGAS